MFLAEINYDPSLREGGSFVAVFPTREAAEAAIVETVNVSDLLTDLHGPFATVAEIEAEVGEIFAFAITEVAAGEFVPFTPAAFL